MRIGQFFREKQAQTKKQRLFSWFVLVFYVFVNLCSQSEAFQFEQHKKIWYYCFGIPYCKDEESAQFNKVLKFLSTDCIDYESFAGNSSSVIKEIKKLSHDKFSWGRYSHRIFFHWGYFKDIRSSKVWTKIWKQQIIPGFESHEKEILDLLRRTWSERKNKIESRIRVDLKLSHTKAQNFAALLYNIHVLSDHVSAADKYKQQAMAPLDDIRAEIMRSISCIFEPQIIIASKVEERLPVKQNYNTEDAREMLDSLSVILPDLFIKDGDFIKVFRDMNLKISKQARNSCEKPW